MPTIKTSTGKVPVNATLRCGAHHAGGDHATDSRVGFGPAGGVKNAEQAAEYLDLAASILGDDWVTPRTFRFGASSLLASLLATLGHGPAPVAGSGY